MEFAITVCVLKTLIVNQNIPNTEFSLNLFKTPLLQCFQVTCAEEYVEGVSKVLQKFYKIFNRFTSKNSRDEPSNVLLINSTNALINDIGSAVDKCRGRNSSLSKPKPKHNISVSKRYTEEVKNFRLFVQDVISVLELQ